MCRERNNHAADDINSCEFSVNAADHIILCCMDFRIFWNFIMLWDTQKFNAVRQYKFMLSWHSILCCSWPRQKNWRIFCVNSSISYCVLPLVFVQGNNHAADDINLCEFTANAAGHIILSTAAFLLCPSTYICAEKQSCCWWH